MKIENIIDGVVFIKVRKEKSEIAIDMLKYKKDTNQPETESFIFSKIDIFQKSHKNFLTFVESFPIIYYEEETIDLNAYKINCKNEFLNLMELAAVLEPFHKSFNLDYILKKVCIWDMKNYTEVFKIAVVLNCLLCRLWIKEQQGNIKKNIFEEITQSNIKWKWTKYLIAPPLFSGEQYDYVLLNEPKSEITSKRVNLKDLKRYEELLRDEKLWSRKGFKYVYREEQENISKKIRENYEKQQRIFIEAPTGSGKSFAYILTAAICTYENMKNKNKEGTNFIISTDTKELQNQLIEKDIPNLLKTLNLQDKIKYGAMKGKKNYLCIDRLKKCQKIDNELTYIFLNRFAADGEYGDLENINYWAFTYFNIEKYVNEINCDSENCNFIKCKKPCYLRNRFNELPEDNITVVNHSLLASWPYEEKRELNNIIIDEAHNLMEKTYDFFTEEFNTSEFIKFLKVINEEKPSLVFMLKKLNASYGYRLEIDIEDFKKKVAQIEFNIFNILSGMRKVGFEEKEYNFTDEINNSEYVFRKFLNSLREPLDKLKNSIYALYRTLDKLVEEIVGNNKDKSSEYNFISNYLSKLKGAYDIIDNFLSHDKKYARIINIDKSVEFFTLRNTPLNIGELLNEKVFNNAKSITFLSATLRINNSYETIKKILQQSSASEYTVNPVFNLKRRTRIFIPRDIGDYRSKTYIDNSVKLIIDLAKESSGHMLVLFNNNNRRDLFKRQLEVMVKDLGVEIHMSKKAIPLLKDRDRKIILLGSKSFFEGIDLPGDSLSCVIFDKIPNINPKDPLFKALKAYKNFNYKEYNYSKVSIRMKQGYGRLIRSIYDYGYFIILDGGSNKETVRAIEKDLDGPYIKYAFIEEIISYIGRDLSFWQKENLRMILNDMKKEEVIEKFNEISQSNNLFWKIEEFPLEKDVVKFRNLKSEVNVSFH